MKTPAIVSLALLFSAACGAPAEKSGSDAAASASGAVNSATAATALPRPCDLVTVAELNESLAGEVMTQKAKTQPDGSVASCDWLGSGASTTNGNIRVEVGGQARYEIIRGMTAPTTVMGPLEELAGIGTAAFAGYHNMSGIGMAQVTFWSGGHIVTVTVGAEETVHDNTALRSICRALATKAAERMKQA